MSENASGFEIIKPRNVLCDLPLLVKERIVRHADMVTRLALQQCSKDFKKVVEISPKEISSIFINVKEDSVSCRILFDWLGHITTFDREDEYDSCDVREAIHWLKKHVPSRAPVTLGTFSVLALKSEADQEILERLGLLGTNVQQILAARRYKLCVKALEIQIANDEQEILKVLPYLEAGALEDINVRTLSRAPISLDTVVELDQWKQAKRLITSMRIEVTFDKLKHFQQVTFRARLLTVELVREIVEHFISTPGCKSLAILSFSTSNFPAIKSFLRQYGPVFLEKQKVKCPGTREIVEIKATLLAFKVCRKPIYDF